MVLPYVFIFQLAFFGRYIIIYVYRVPTSHIIYNRYIIYVQRIHKPMKYLLHYRLGINAYSDRVYVNYYYCVFVDNNNMIIYDVYTLFQTIFIFLIWQTEISNGILQKCTQSNYYFIILGNYYFFTQVLFKLFICFIKYVILHLYIIHITYSCVPSASNIISYCNIYKYVGRQALSFTA